ncbi:MAG TPA: hypothetical protein EYG95_05640 [Campylobacterales bacterium]|nr:hypothetical protein [Campylobacterales bacterium]
MKKIIALSLLTSSLLVASGYRLPESSINSTALSAAYLANAHGADSAYYNPANMVFQENKHLVEGALTYIKLGEITYTDNRPTVAPLFNSISEGENLFAPSAFYVSPFVNCFRFGISMVVPGGLTKRWESPYAKAYSEEFTLQVVEVNPVVAYKMSDQLAIGGGLRLIHSSGIIKSDASGVGKPVSRDMEADSYDFGYNVAATYKPTSALSLAATYRSNVNLTEEGNAKLSLSGTKLYDGGASVTVPLPAVAAVAVAYTFGSTTIELEYDRTFWSEYKELDFDFEDDVPLALKVAFDDPKPRNWKDTNAYRVGMTHQMNKKLTLMGGFAIDENPAPEAHVGFELPDSDAMLYSGGFRYQYSEAIEIGASVLYDAKDDRKVTTDDGVLDGEFTDSNALLVTTGIAYKF